MAKQIGVSERTARCEDCGAAFAWEHVVDVENGPSPDDLDQAPSQCPDCSHRPCQHGTPGGTFCPTCETPASVVAWTELLEAHRDSSASRLLRTIERELARMRRMGLDKDQRYRVITSAVEQILNHSDLA